MPGESLTNKSISKEMKESSYLIVSQDEEINGELMQALRKIPIAVLSKYLGVDDLKKVANQIPFSTEVVDISLSMSMNSAEYIVGTNGEFVSNANCNVAMFDVDDEGNNLVKENTKYKISGCCSAYYPLVVFFDSEGNVLGYAMGNDADELTQVNEYEVVTPKGTTSMYVNYFITMDSAPASLSAAEVREMFEVGCDDLSADVLAMLGGKDAISIAGELMSNGSVSSEDEKYNSISLDMVEAKKGLAFVVKESQTTWWGSDESLPLAGDLIVSMGTNASAQDNWLVLSGPNTKRAIATAQETADNAQADIDALKEDVKNSKNKGAGYVPSDIEYEIVEGVKLNTQGKALIEDADCFTVYIKIPEKKFAAIYATAKNATVLVSTSTYGSMPAICDADKNPIANKDGVYNRTNNSQGNVLTVFGTNYINNYDNPVYCALSYTNGTAFEVGLFGADAVTKSYLSISETDLPKGFIVDGENLVKELYDVRWSTNGYFQYNPGSTNLFEVEYGDVLFHNGRYIYLHYFDENYTYLGGSPVLNSGVTSIEKENVRYAYAYSTVAGNISSDFWISRVDLSRKKHRPSRIINPEYVDLYDIEKKQLNSWYNGKRISFIGDSLTGTGTGSFYINYLDDYFGFGAKTNCGVGGTCVCGSGVKAFWYDERVNAVDINSDVIFVAGGTNDANNNKTIGEASISNCDTETFIGAYNVLISKLLYKFYKLDSGYYSSIDYSGVTQVETVKPVKIFLVTPPYMMGNETAYNKTPAFAEAVVNIGKLTGYPVCDTRANSGVNIMLAEYYKTLNNDGTSDYVHLSEEAHKEWAKVMVGKMLEVEPLG